MTYQFDSNGNITKDLGGGTILSLLNTPNSSAEWQAYEAWLSKGNTPLPAPEQPSPPVLTPAEKLAAAGLTVSELKELLGLT